MLGQVFSLIILKELEDYSIAFYLKSVIIPLVIVTIGGILIAYVPTLILCEGFKRMILVGVVSTIAISFLSYVFGLNDMEKNIIKNIIRVKRKKILV